jgi:peptidoglycan/xylan/chitin deacetylase (PgdA/CDA1 family)
MKTSIRVLLVGLAIPIVAVETVSAPIEWLWPYSMEGNTHWHGRASGNCVSLTFDDGPSRYTEAFLDILENHETSATFFVMGVQVSKFPETIMRMASQGHEIGNHTYSFQATKGLRILYTTLEEDQVIRTQHAVRAITGASPRFFRSPGGQMGRGLWQMVNSLDLEVVNGALPFPDPTKDADTQLKTILDTVRPGAIIILHDGDDRNPESDRPRATLEMLPRLLNKLKLDGYKIVPLEKLLYRERC